MTAMTSTRPPYDPELADLLANSPLPSTITPDMIGFLRAHPFGPGLDELLATRPLRHHEVTIPVAGGEITASVFTPTDRAVTSSIYHLHGGGMIIGNRFTGIEHVLDWAVQYGAVVVSPEYRLAPEHPAPTPVEDAYAGLEWLAANAAGLGVDPERILLIGTSAGGGLAAGVTLLARERRGPEVIAQMLLSPMLDDRDATASSRQYTQTGSWSRESNATGWDALLGDRRKTDDVHPASARPERMTSPAFLRRSSTSAPPRSSGMRTSPTRPGCGSTASRPSCTSGPVGSTSSTARRPARFSRARPRCAGIVDRPDARPLSHRVRPSAQPSEGRPRSGSATVVSPTPPLDAKEHDDFRTWDAAPRARGRAAGQLGDLRARAGPSRAGHRTPGRAWPVSRAGAHPVLSLGERRRPPEAARRRASARPLHHRQVGAEAGGGGPGPTGEVFRGWPSEPGQPHSGRPCPSGAYRSGLAGTRSRTTAHLSADQGAAFVSLADAVLAGIDAEVGEA